MLTIRFRRVGRRHAPSYRLVVTDSRNSPKTGKYVEAVGFYDPRRKEATTINAERVSHWIARGAQSSDTVHNLLVTKGIITAKKRNALPKHRPPVKEAAPEAQTASLSGAAAAEESAPEGRE